MVLVVSDVAGTGWTLSSLSTINSTVPIAEGDL
jgi:hypothetical protein